MSDVERIEDVLSRIAKKRPIQPAGGLGDALVQEEGPPEGRKPQGDVQANVQCPSGDERSLIVLPSSGGNRHGSTSEEDLAALACPKCKEFGYFRANVPFGHPNFGKLMPCECKQREIREKRLARLRALSSLGAFDYKFTNFNFRAPGAKDAYDITLSYSKEPEGWLLLVGRNGCGKTHLAIAVAQQCLADGRVVLFAVVPDLLDQLRATFAPSSTEAFDQLFSQMREAEVLVLDDLGTQQSSPWANEKLFQLLNYRYNQQLATVITANPRGLQSVDERIGSRLTDSNLVERVTFNYAGDYRPHKPKKSAH